MLSNKQWITKVYARGYRRVVSKIIRFSGRSFFVYIENFELKYPCKSIPTCTDIHKWPLQPFSQDYGLASHINHVVCVKFIRQSQRVQFGVESAWIFEKLFHGRFIYAQSFCHISFWCLTWESRLYVQQADTLPTRLRRHVASKIMRLSDRRSVI